MVYMWYMIVNLLLRAEGVVCTCMVNINKALMLRSDTMHLEFSSGITILT